MATIIKINKEIEEILRKKVEILENENSEQLIQVLCCHTKSTTITFLMNILYYSFEDAKKIVEYIYTNIVELDDTFLDIKRKALS